MSTFRLFKSVSDAGWMLAPEGHAKRSVPRGKQVLLRDPTRPGGMLRLLCGARVTLLQLRVHDASKCTVGRWETILKLDTPSGAAAWGQLADRCSRFYDKYRDCPRGWDWAACDSKSFQGRTRAHANRHEPSPVGGPGRGSTSAGLPGGHKALGWAPSGGFNGCATRRLTRAERDLPKGTTGAMIDAREADNALWLKSQTDSQRTRRMRR